MQKKIFITQQMLDRLSSEDKISIEGVMLTLFTKDKPAYKLTPAVKFLAIESKESDPHKLVGKIVTQKSVEEKGIELYMNSAIYQDEAYKVEQGFTGELASASPPDAQPAGNSAPTPAAYGEEKGEEKGGETMEKEEQKSDDELLADFLLKNM